MAIVLGFLGLDHYTFNWVSGGAAVTVTDSTIVVAPIVEEVSPVQPATTDTVKVDTTKK